MLKGKPSSKWAVSRSSWFVFHVSLLI